MDVLQQGVLERTQQYLDEHISFVELLQLLVMLEAARETERAEAALAKVK